MWFRFMRHACTTLRVLTISVPEWCGKLRLDARGCCTCVRASDQRIYVSCLAPYRTNSAALFHLDTIECMCNMPRNHANSGVDSLVLPRYFQVMRTLIPPPVSHLVTYAPPHVA
ncbi:unnamed protein product [Ectocarpus sp. 4 AP-2014]